MDPTIVSREYGFLQADPSVYVNTCTVGIPPACTQAAGNRFMAGYTDYAMGMDFDRYERLRANVRGMLAGLIGGEGEEIALTKNTTEGVCILAAGYPLGPGDNVVTCDLENQSNLFPWFHNARLRGYELRVAKTTRGRITPGEVEALMDEHTKIVSLSAVQAGTGYFADLKAIGALCRSSGALLAVDAIQALGRIPLNVRELGVGYLSCGGFKGLLSGLGTGFLWCDKRIMTQIIPPHVGFLSGGPYFSPPRVTPGDIDFQLADSYNRFEAGTHNVHGIALMESSVGLILELGPENIGRHVLDLERLLRQRLANTGFDVLTPESEDRRSGLLVLYYPKEHQQGVDNILQAHRIKLTHRGGYIRLAFGIHNTAEDVDKIAQAMEEIDNRILKGK